MHSKSMGRSSRRTDVGHKLGFRGGLRPIPLGGGPPLLHQNRQSHLFQSAVCSARMTHSPFVPAASSITTHGPRRCGSTHDSLHRWSMTSSRPDLLKPQDPDARILEYRLSATTRSANRVQCQDCPTTRRTFAIRPKLSSGEHGAPSIQDPPLALARLRARLPPGRCVSAGGQVAVIDRLVGRDVL
jgi:hypothetical protein